MTLGVGVTLVGTTTSSATPEEGNQEFSVVYADGVSAAAARAAVKAAGGSIVEENADVGVATVVSRDARFAERANASPALVGAARNRVVAANTPDRARTGRDIERNDVEKSGRDGSHGPSKHDNKGRPGKGHGKPTAITPEPLADLQWDMEAIGATATGSYAVEQGKGVRVGILDTGVDGSHPDIAPNFDAALSRNFTTDVPVDANGDDVDGACEDEPDQSCEDAADVDENGHGTHVASTIASPINGFGIAGVAPEATIVNLRAGQDSGYFFLQPSVDALTYAARNGIDVVNMSYYVDPWLFNCVNHPADSPEDQAEQQVVITAMQRALDFAHKRGVTLVSAAGNGATDYTKQISDESSPDFADVPGEVAHVRDLLDPESCISMPSEGEHVISVSSTGPSGRKAYYSDYGNGYIDVAAPGGDVYDTAAGTRDYAGGILAAYPTELAISEGAIDPDTGEVLVPWAVADTHDGVTAYYQYLQGTSMASPHAAGVAALIVGKYGHRDGRQGLTASPDLVERVLLRTAEETACPTPADFTYTRTLANGNVVTDTHTCEGTPESNGFFGAGLVSASAAVARR